VIDELNSYEAAGSDYLFCNGNVCRRGLSVSCGMVMDEYDGGRGVLYGRAEYLARMHQIRVDSADGEYLVMHNLVPSIQVESAQMLFGKGSHVSDVLEDIAGSAHYGKRRRILLVETSTELSCGYYPLGFAERNARLASESFGTAFLKY
jgi:hypothetical protein